MDAKNTDQDKSAAKDHEKLGGDRGLSASSRRQRVPVEMVMTGGVIKI